MDLNEIESAGREQGKEDLDSPQETAHILRGGSNPSTTRQFSSIHTDALVFKCQWEYVWLLLEEKEMHSSVPEEEEKKTMMGSEGGVNRGSSKNTNISGGFYMMTVYLPAVIICVSTTAQQHFKNRGPL